MLIFDFVENKIPKLTAVKYRENHEFLMIESANLEIFYLNGTAKDFVLLCNGQNNFSQIKDKLMKIYDVQEDILKNDLIDLIRDLQWKKLMIVE